MKILCKKLTKKQFEKYLEEKKISDPLPNKIVLHHTWKPTIETWKGKTTIQALKINYEKKGWSAGPHIFVAEDGIWLFTDMNKVGTHAGTGNATWEKEGIDIHGYYVAGAHLKNYSIGVEVVGNYDEKVWEGEVLQNTCHCLTQLQKKLNLEIKDIKFHRDYSPKSCPGNSITREWFEYTLKAYQKKNKLSHGYEYQFSPEEAQKAIELEFLKQIDSETREIIAIGLVRVYERIKKEFGNDIPIGVRRKK